MVRRVKSRLSLGGLFGPGSSIWLMNTLESATARNAYPGAPGWSRPSPPTANSGGSWNRPPNGWRDDFGSRASGYWYSPR